jgi:murein L,D-transpeptidase YcbB/YkuD
MSWVWRRLSAAPRLFVILALLALLLVSLSASAHGQQDLAAASIRRQIQQLPASQHYLADFYRARAYRPLWSRNGQVLDREARSVLDWIEHAADDGLQPDSRQVQAVRDAIGRASGGGPRDLAQLDLTMSDALARYEAKLRRPRADIQLVVTDPALAPPGPLSVLRTVEAAPSMAEHLATARQMHPIYETFRAERLRLAARHSAETADQERLLLANMERARMLPAKAAGRYILVDAVAARLWLYEDGEVAGSMRVVVGKTSQATPIMSGLIRYAVFNPYWNMPPDLVRDQLAKKVLRQGPAVVERDRLELLSDWTQRARPIAPQAVDWKSVQAGELDLRVRQRPGPGNMMGRVKFMFPNRLGVYLHDTSDHRVFAREERRLSAGCVRVQDAERLARWLGRPLPTSRARVDWRVDLPSPIPVYITYFSLPTDPGAKPGHADPYGRDAVSANRPLMAGAPATPGPRPAVVARPNLDVSA